MGSLSTTSLWIQFRGGMLGLYSWDLHAHKHRLVLEKRFVLNHPGFCRGVYDAPHERFIMPDKIVSFKKLINLCGLFYRLVDLQDFA